MSHFPRVALLGVDDDEIAVRYAGDPAWEDPAGGRGFSGALNRSLDAVAAGELASLTMPDGRFAARIRVRVRFS